MVSERAGGDLDADGIVCFTHVSPTYRSTVAHRHDRARSRRNQCGVTYDRIERFEASCRVGDQARAAIPHENVGVRGCCRKEYPLANRNAARGRRSPKRQQRSDESCR